MTVKQLLRAWENISDHDMWDEIKNKNYNDISLLVDYGCFDIYYDQQRDSLKYIYDETDEEADKYDNDQVFAQYKHVIALAGSSVHRHQKLFDEFMNGRRA